MARIRALSSEVVSRLRSDVAATTFAQCVEELLMNSLDAGATIIDVQVEAPPHRAIIACSLLGYSGLVSANPWLCRWLQPLMSHHGGCIPHLLA